MPVSQVYLHSKWSASGGQEAFLDLMLPVVLATIKHFEAHQQQTSGLDPRVRKALRRRERMKARPCAQGESDAVFKVCNPLLCHLRGP